MYIYYIMINWLIDWETANTIHSAQRVELNITLKIKDPKTEW